MKNFKSVLSTADLVKFAKSAPGSKTAILDKQLLETVLVDTKEAIPEPTEEELLQNEEYLKKIQAEKKKKLLINITKSLSIIIFTSLISSISIFGWEEVKDYLFGNSTKEPGVDLANFTKSAVDSTDLKFLKVSLEISNCPASFSNSSFTINSFVVLSNASTLTSSSK